MYAVECSGIIFSSFSNYSEIYGRLGENCLYIFRNILTVEFSNWKIKVQLNNPEIVYDLSIASPYVLIEYINLFMCYQHDRQAFAPRDRALRLLLE